ncbi:MAG: hypothetical protein CMJ98_12280 [Planctomycetes bacterium]|nr:hypothetical protein [Planctomycetota bacterium]HJM56796.1 hypothetical protein [Planctomycetota bacterium]
MKHFLRTAWLLSRLQIRSLVLSRRMLFCLLLAFAPIVIAWIAGAMEHASEIVPFIGMFLVLQVVAPLISLTVGSSVVTEELENRTITYVFTRPTNRAAFFVGRLMASTVVSTILLSLSSLGVIWASTYTREGAANLKRVGRRRGAQEMVEIVRDLPEGLATGLIAAAAAAAIMYTLISAGLGVFFRRAMILSLGYTFAIEGFLANIPGSTQKLSVQFYLRSLLTAAPDKSGSILSDIPILSELTLYTGPEALARLAAAYLIFLLIAAVGIRRRQYMLTS